MFRHLANLDYAAKQPLLTATSSPVSPSGKDADAAARLDDAVTSLRRNGVGLKGVLSTPRGRASKKSLNMQLRTELDLFANVVICKSPVGQCRALPSSASRVLIADLAAHPYSFAQALPPATKTLILSSFARTPRQSTLVWNTRCVFFFFLGRSI